jgi:hypothetical protein
LERHHAYAKWLRRERTRAKPRADESKNFSSMTSSSGSVEAYEHFFFEKLSVLKGVQEINSIVALSEIKLTTELPLNIRTKELIL